jgi:hypothetical protein
MTTGTAIGIGVAVVGAGAVGFLVLRRPKTRIDTGAIGPGAAGVDTVGGASASQPAGGPLDAFTAINTKACKVVAGSKLGGGTAAAGCSAYNNLLSPIALGVTLPLKAINALPLVGGPAKAIERAVSTATPAKVLKLTDLPFSTSSPTANAVSKVALAPIYLGQKTLSVASHAASGAVSALRHLF